jgi:hypothetical protein
MRGQGQRTRRWIYVAIGAGLVLLLAALYAVTLITFENQSSGKKSLDVPAPRGAPQVVSAVVKVSELDPKLGLFQLSMAIAPSGELATDNGLATRYPLDVVAFGLTGRSELRVPAGQVPQEIQLNSGLFDGDVSKYPFDSYRSGFGLEAHAQIGGRTVVVPVETTIEPAFAGFQMNASESQVSKPGAPFVTIDIRRSGTTVGFAVFVMVMMWLLAIAAVVITVRFLLRRHRLELGFTGMFVGLLFAFPAIRNALPGVPPVGVLNDYLAFLWAEGLVALSLLATLALFIRRGVQPSGEGDSGEEKAGEEKADERSAGERPAAEEAKA